MCDPARKVSAHYLIGDGGQIFQLVPDAKRAWHAGVSAWRGKAGLNANSIGIELQNKGPQFGYHDFPAVQICALLNLLDHLCAVHPIPRYNIWGHSDIAPLRKKDPGHLFPWRSLAQAGFGIWPDFKRALQDNDSIQNDGDLSVREVLRMLAYIGYELNDAFTLTAPESKAVLKAFWAHFHGMELTADCAFHMSDMACIVARIQSVYAAAKKAYSGV